VVNVCSIADPAERDDRCNAHAQRVDARRTTAANSSVSRSGDTGQGAREAVAPVLARRKDEAQGGWGYWRGRAGGARSARGSRAWIDRTLSMGRQPSCFRHPGDLSREELERAVAVSEQPALLQELVKTSRRIFGFFTKHYAHTINYPWVVSRLHEFWMSQPA
jgi:hypothetical protein